MIKELILDNDRVVLPGLGCFVAEMVPATFSDKGYTINPPYRRLYFRAKPDTDDVLMNFYAESNGLDRDVACRILGDFIAELRNIIFTKKLIVLPGLGRLRATKENNIFFIADEDLDIYIAGFGLEPISLKTHQESQQEVSAAVVGLRSLLEEAPMVDPVPEVEPEPVAELEPVAEPEPAAEPEPVAESMIEFAAEPETVKESTFWKKMLLALGIIIAVAVMLFIAYIVVAHVAPEWIDSILYTPEELEIINCAL